MNRPMLKRVFPQALAWTALAVLSGAMALAQDSTPAPAPAPAPSPAAATPETPPPAAATRTDGEIEQDVVHALDASKALKSDLITAATIQGEVTLSGTVSSEASSELAEAIAAHVAGVTKVNNNLKVGNPQAPANPDAQPMAENQPGDAGVPNPGDAGAPAMNDGPMPVPNESDAQAQMRAQIRAEVQAQIQAQRDAQQQTPMGPVTLPQGTLLQLRTNEPVNSKRAKDGEPVQFTVIQDVFVGGMLAIPRGAIAHGVVTEVKQAGDLKGSPELALKLNSLDMGGQDYPLETNQFKVKGPGKGEYTAHNIVGGTVMGTIIGCIAGRGIGCGVGAAAGAAAGTAASAATPGPGVWIPAEAKVDFHLSKPLTVTPVSAREAARMAQGLYPGGPTLYRRAYGPYGQPYAYYGYPPVYYRPYYMVGGFYYWR
ncbi:MAG: BON domain-containing protein [Terracidiphilus sp.]